MTKKTVLVTCLFISALFACQNTDRAIDSGILSKTVGDDTTTLGTTVTAILDTAQVESEWITPDGFILDTGPPPRLTTLGLEHYGAIVESVYLLRTHGSMEWKIANTGEAWYIRSNDLGAEMWFLVRDEIYARVREDTPDVLASMEDVVNSLAGTVTTFNLAGKTYARIRLYPESNHAEYVAGSENLAALLTEYGKLNEIFLYIDILLPQTEL